MSNQGWPPSGNGPNQPQGPLPPAGWYPDPGDPSQQRYWDGQRWTDQTMASGGFGNPPGYGSPPGGWGSQPGGFGQPQGGWGAPPGGQLNTWLVPAIAATVLCCIPAGIVAIVFAAKAASARDSGNWVGAQRYAGLARTWTLVTVGLGLLAAVVVIATFPGGL